jgi:hypothetical protein
MNAEQRTAKNSASTGPTAIVAAARQTQTGTGTNAAQHTAAQTAAHTRRTVKDFPNNLASQGRPIDDPFR